ncbi:putative StAR-related lipid transfer protein 10 [Monocercomonoides exilis]|uniref:putative StAR-related lipid transfer protein 10 n=1 Tax=Monocercomonoides exilis TaxID=2049356 RepID=UPI00355A36E0|nr:putative StAR-related lipid transfer protein 10 [Monocercomonoides exilis]|eukprot:MONOS_3367.1-p1 / transcript=MONOS_3367.1 / gene=MONOS_3367 / organism=Monocercomonoides_exilis_PA203 / gene_product=unspecified product / transcript_product=unspecified product / location=Mono_scaffold00078:131405-132108(+) / protein_length=202 / sequence_SO=supercontig / SO=protein_coding / is_pseudo=false
MAAPAFPNPDELRERLVKTINDESIWKKEKDDKGIEIFVGKDDSKFKMFRGIGYIDEPIATLIPIVTDREKRKEWNEAFIGSDVIEQITPESKLIHPMFRAGAAKNRDFCCFASERSTETEFIEAQTSVEDPRVPPHKDFQRATVLLSGMHMTSVSPTRTRVLYMAQIDLGGWVPAMIGNMINMKQPLCIAKIRDYAEKQKK